jgi:hypothetical protein
VSKGSTARPLSVPQDQFGTSHAAIFGERKRVQWVPPGQCGELSADYSSWPEAIFAPEFAEACEQWRRAKAAKPDGYHRQFQIFLDGYFARAALALKAEENE